MSDGHICSECRSVGDSKPFTLEVNVHRGGITGVVSVGLCYGCLRDASVVSKIVRQTVVEWSYTDSMCPGRAGDASLQILKGSSPS